MKTLPLGFVVSGVVGAMVFASAGCGSGSGNGTLLNYPTATPSPASSPTPTPMLPPTDGPVSVVGRYQSLVFTLSAPKQVYKAGDTAALTLTVQNTGNTDVSAADAAFFAEDAAYPDATVQGQSASPTSGNFRLFLTDTVFKAGQFVSHPIDLKLTAFAQPLTYRTIRVYVPAADGGLVAPSVSATTEFIGLTVQ